MRAVRLVGLADGGREVVCEDPTTGEQFLLARDDKLRAAARGDLGRFGAQLTIDEEAKLSPREIQARIRAGASVESVAALAGTSLRRIERFAHPVMLERTTMAEKARHARPTIDGIHSTTSVEEAVAANLAARGHDGDVTWDAYRDDADWVLVLAWHMGRTLNRAQWTFHPGPAGGTLTARDENAADIVDPALRVLRPLPQAAPAAATPDVAPAAPEAAREAVPVETAIADVAAALFTGTDGASRPAPAPAGPASTPTAPAAKVEGAPKPAAARPTPVPRPAGRKGNRPAMPSWEDVLLSPRSK